MTKAWFAAAVLAVCTVATADDRKPAAPARPAAPSKLAITSIEPSKGDADGGTYVRLRGQHFLEDAAAGPAAKIYFGSHQGTIIRFADDSTIIAEAPGGKIGETVDVLLVLDGRGELKLPKAFTFVAKK